MAESNHDPPNTGQIIDTPNVTLNITSINESDGTSDHDTLALEAPREEDQTSDFVSPIKKEDQFEVLVDEAPKDQDDPHHAGLPTEPVGVFPHLQMAMNSAEVDVLSSHQSTGARILRELTQILSSNMKSVDMSRMASIKALQDKTNNPQTIIGVVGGTGHGKSSLINALLGENKLVPTNCFRACTAVVTEISYNNKSDNPDHRYIAEVEFISVEDWDRELGYLFQDLVASSGEMSSEGQFEQSDAGVAWAKIKAVYPKFTRQTIMKTSAEALAADSAVKSLLGTIKTVRKPTADELYEGIQIYVDSKRKMKFDSTGKEQLNGTNKLRLWPLIKVVRIYTKADVLSSGAVIVDLPGTKDSNAARAAVAGKYIEKCDNLWVVSMITRAVDDQAAQELLGTGFKQQLKLDGNYLNVTFVCSKTDDIDVHEAADGLGFDEEIRRLNSAKHNLSTLEASTELEKLKKRKAAVSTYADEVDKHIDRYEKLRTPQTNGETVIPPKEYPRKRKIGVHPMQANKRRRVGLDERSQETQWVSTEDLWGDLEKGMPKFSAEHHLTLKDIQLMTDYLRSHKQTANEEKDTLEEKISGDEYRLQELQEEVQQLGQQLHIACVSRRNDCSRRDIQDQFALGLKEILSNDDRLDQQEAQSIDPDNFDPENELRDYAEVGRSLPVFCISSTAYRSLLNEEVVDGFSDINDTGIPQLRAHAKKLTESARKSNAKSFLNDLAQTFNSLYLWSSKKDTKFYLTEEEMDSEMGYMKERINELEKRFLGVLRQQPFTPLIARQILLTAGHPTNEVMVACVVNGPRDFNEDLAAPLLQRLGNDWEITFTKKIPGAIERHAVTCRIYQEFIQDLITSRLQGKAVFNGISGMLRDQDKARSNWLTDKINSVIPGITTSQRDANREFTPRIMKKLTPKYKECSEDKGRGVFSRIRLEMETEISKHRRAILKASCKTPKSKLSEIPKNIQHEVQVYVDIMRDRMVSDYTNVILGADSSEESRLLRESVFTLLNEVDEQFK
ncbi:hypothetical protein CHU98_g878 [Xylaria longipes]|nr:hypothetical protein CHU98_g878 [Xylaria longipes]